MKMKKPAKKPVVDLIIRGVVNGYLYDLDGIKLPKNGLVDIYENAESFGLNEIPVGKARCVVKYGKLIAQIEDLDESHYGSYLVPNITSTSRISYKEFTQLESSKLDFLFLDELPLFGNPNLSIKEQVSQKNHIQDYFTVDRINELCKQYNVGVLEISDYTGIQYNSLHQYLGGDKSKPKLKLSKVVRAAIYLYFKAVFKHEE